MNYSLRFARWAVIGLVVATAVQLTGCGGSKSSTPTAPVTYDISGTVSGAVAQGVTIILTGAATASTASAAGGAYTLSGLANGSYTVTPVLNGYAFVPPSRSATINGASSSGNGFVATSVPPTYTISGTVSGAVQVGVAISLSGDATASTTTDASGQYVLAGLADGNYTVTATRSGFTFTPPSRAVTVTGANATGKNFVAASAAVTYTLSGVVSGDILQGVTINLAGSATTSTTTDVAGNYSLSGLANGSYTVTPVLSGYAFNPTQKPVTINGTNSTANNFVSSQMHKYIYYKRGGTTVPDTATFVNGTLSIDGKTRSGLYLVHGAGGGTAFDGNLGDFITSSSSPTYTPEMTLVCGPDPVTATPNTLVYVLFDVADNNRVTATAQSLLNALQSEHNYLGIYVYGRCSNSADHAWIRNYPQTNYYYWPDVFTTYSAPYVANLLSGAVIYSTPTAGNNYNAYVVVRVGASLLEVWH